MDFTHKLRVPLGKGFFLWLVHDSSRHPQMVTASVVHREPGGWTTRWTKEFTFAWSMRIARFLGGVTYHNHSLEDDEDEDLEDTKPD